MNIAAPYRNASCQLCPRLANFLAQTRSKNPAWHNAPVNGYGPLEAPILLVGLAPGMKGANRTGRPFTGDVAGHLLFQMMAKFHLSKGCYDARPDDGVVLTKIRIVNAVRCVPPNNNPTGAEINTCRQFLVQDIDAMPNLKVIITIGQIAHESTLKALNLKKQNFPFVHGQIHNLPNGLTLVSSYHCSGYNTSTGRLTPQMFRDVFDKATHAAGLCRLSRLLYRLCCRLGRLSLYR